MTKKNQLTKKMLDEAIDKMVKKELLKEENTIMDYKYSDAAEQAVNQAFDAIQHFNDAFKTDSNHPNVQEIKKKMQTLEVYLDKFGTSLNKLRNKF